MMNPELLTLGDLSRELDVPKYRITYALEKTKIPVRTRAGIIRMYGRDQLDDIRGALAAVRSRSPHAEPVAP